MGVTYWIGTDSGNEGDYSVAANWSGAAVPIAGDDVIIANTSQSITAGLNQSAVALSSITIDASFTGYIGSSASDFLQVAASTVVIGQKRGNIGTFTGSKRLNIDLGSSTAAQVSVFSTAGSALDANRTPLRFKAGNASTDFKIFNGNVSISDDSSDTSTFGDCEVYGGVCTIGEAATLTNITMNGGRLECYSAVAGTATIKGGTFNIYDTSDTSTIATLTVQDAGVVNHYASGTITTCNLNGGLLDLTKTQKAKTITTLTINKNASLIIDSANVTLTNKIALASSTVLTISTR